MHILIQIWRWLMQPKLWRFIGFSSAVIGLLCYALSSSFNYLFGEWNLLKIFLYSVFSFIICMAILFAKVWQHSTSLRFKAHTAFLVLTITSLYSFFFDKVMNGKPDAYSLISCASFAIMSLSLSRQNQCGFEVDLLYFFLGFLLVQLLKIKLPLFIVGVAFSYSLIIIRSSFPSIDNGSNNQYHEVQDGNSVVLHIDSLQMDSTADIVSNNSIDNDSPQLVMISTGFDSMMEQLGTCVKALQDDNLNLVQMLLEHVKKNTEEQSQLVVMDPNFTMDALKPETIKGLEETAKVMMRAGFEKDFSDVYRSCRRECLDKCLMHIQKLSIEDVHNMPWKDLEGVIERWIKVFNVAVKILFPGERRLCDRIFFQFSSAAHFSFMEICRGSTIQLLNFANFVATGSHSPERLFKILKVFETLRDVIPEFESLFCDQYSVSLRNEAITIWKRLGEAIKGIFMELKNLIRQDLTNVIDLGGGVHPITQYVMSYLCEVCRSRITLEQVFDVSSLSEQMRSIMDVVESNLEAKSKLCEEPSLQNIFSVNNSRYLFQMTKDNELGTLLGKDWIQKHSLKVWHYDEQYKNEDTIAPALVQPRSYDTINTMDVQQQLLDSIQKIGEIEGRNAGGSKGSKGYEGDVQKIEALPSEQAQRLFLNQWRRSGRPATEFRPLLAKTIHFPADQHRSQGSIPEVADTWRRSIELLSSGRNSRKNDPEIRTIVVSSAPQFGNADEMAPEDGFAWNYEKMIRDGFNYPRMYFQCYYMKLYACEAKKQVQQLHNNEHNQRIFEVQYHGGHSCCTSLTITSSTSYSEWLSSSIPAKSINSIPEVKLAAPADGGHHPMMHRVVRCLVSAIRSSQQIVVVNGDVAFSLATQMEEAMKLLENILVSKSEKYVDTALRDFFMTNNWRYLEVTHRRNELVAIFGNFWFEITRTKVQQNLELYQRNSWDKVLDFLKLDINDSVEPNFAVNLMKEKLSLFNMHFTETCRVQCTWSVHDKKLRKEIIESLKNTLLPAYGIFIGKFQDLLKNNAYEYIEYGMFDIHDILDNLFLGHKDRHINSL